MIFKFNTLSLFACLGICELFSFELFLISDFEDELVCNRSI